MDESSLAASGGKKSQQTKPIDGSTVHRASRHPVHVMSLGATPAVSFLPFLSSSQRRKPPSERRGIVCWFSTAHKQSSTTTFSLK